MLGMRGSCGALGLGRWLGGLVGVRLGLMGVGVGGGGLGCRLCCGAGAGGWCGWLWWLLLVGWLGEWGDGGLLLSGGVR